MTSQMVIRSTVALALLGGAAVAADLPFYKAGTDAPVRAAASVATAAQAVGLDSRTVQTVASAAIAFRSNKFQGTILMFR